jgi:hypothetical protein
MPTLVTQACSKLPPMSEGPIPDTSPYAASVIMSALVKVRVTSSRFAILKR